MKRFTLYLSSFALAAVFVAGIAAPKTAQAISGADWQAGRIIDDAVFYNKDSMSVDQIQQFLNSKVPTCDTWGTKPYGSGTRADYGRSQGVPPPYICVKDYWQNPQNGQDNFSGSVPAGAKSAAQLIWDVSHQFNINPQVILTTIHKESLNGVLLDDWPWPIQYRSLTGYACPDGGNLCNAQYYGFYNQIYNTARQFRLYANNPNSFNHVPGRVNSIRWSPTASCGSGNVFIHNQATASLYNYTPYQPNQAALNDLNGQGDGCSAHGNRNFWKIFYNWFGSPYHVYSWTTVNQSAYFDGNKQMPTDLGKLGPGQRYYLVVVVKNTGNVTWERNGPNPVNLGTTSPQDRASPFCDATWISASPGCNRTVMLHEYSVAPGQYGSFEFWITTPPNPGSYNEIYAPVMEGVTWMNSSTISFPMIVNPATYSGTILNQYAYTDDSKQTTTDIAHLVPGKRYYIGLTVKNTGDMTWQRLGPNPVNLGTTGGRDRASPFCDATWQSCNRAAYLHEYSVIPGQHGSFEFWITAPSTGNYTENYAPVIENTGWMDNLPVAFNMNVEPYNYALGAIRAFTNSSKQTSISLDNLAPGQRYYASIDAQNRGWATWQRLGNNPVMLGTANSRDRASPFCDSTWPGCNRPALLHEYSVGSAQNGSFEFWITAPNTPGNYSESYIPVVEGINWMGTRSIDVAFKVNPPVYTWDIVDQKAYGSSAKTAAVNLGNLQPGQRYYLTMTVKNTGNTVWKSTGQNPMSVGTAGPRDRTSPFCDATWLGCNRPALLHEYAVAPGQYGSFEFWITTPSTKTSYNELYAPVIEGMAWLDSHTASFPMIVN